ncbi:hypothetical protein PILCRDRAFT_157425 [Piloderma croceum F 1598]|uniref:Uncharacterized protein n=1 Tax=Piloderma croceum (strain F 1598) TaxID=765440 RepID=A0A0C3GH37_PILCF|nr:hypothetical protein PILCRDRAFT_157425 [Piloderma croceum F 1598]
MPAKPGHRVQEQSQGLCIFACFSESSVHGTSGPVVKSVRRLVEDIEVMSICDRVIPAKRKHETSGSNCPELQKQHSECHKRINNAGWSAQVGFGEWKGTRGSEHVPQDRVHAVGTPLLLQHHFPNHAASCSLKGINSIHRPGSDLLSLRKYPGSG